MEDVIEEAVEFKDIIVKLFKKIDFFSKNIQLTINRKQSYRTMEGGLLSLCLLTIVTVILGYYLEDVINYKNPFFFIEKSELLTPPFYTLNNTNFFFGVRLEDDSNLVYTDPSYYEFTYRYDEYIYPNIKNHSDYLYSSYEANLVKCTPEHMQIKKANSKDYEPVNEKYFIDNSLDTFLCPNFDNGLIGGGWAENVMRLFSVFAKKCDSSTEQKYNIICKPDSVYDKTFYVGFKLSNYLIHPNNQQNPIKQSFYYNFISVVPTLKKYLYINLAQAEFSSDDNYFFGKNSKSKMLILDDYRLDSVTSDKYTNKILMEIPITITRSYTTYNRTYLKIQDVLGIVSGFLGMFVYALSFIFNIYLSIIYKFFLYDSILDFRQKETKKAWGGGNRKDSIAIDQIMQEDFDSYNVKGDSESDKDKGSNTINEDNLQIINVKRTISEEINNQELKTVGFNGGAVELQYIDKDINTPQNLERKNDFDKSMIIHDIEDKNPEPESNQMDLRGFEVDSNFAKNHSSQSINRFDDAKITMQDKNPMLEQMIQKFKKKRECLKPIEITTLDYFCYKYFFSCLKMKSESNKKRQIIKLSENEMYRRMDLVKLMKHLDQISILEKILLNKHQVFMLENKAKQIVFNRHESNNITLGENEIKENKILDLIEYIKKQKLNNKLGKDDYILLENLDIEIKQRILKEVEMDF